MLRLNSTDRIRKITVEGEEVYSTCHPTLQGGTEIQLLHFVGVAKDGRGNSIDMFIV